MAKTPFVIQELDPVVAGSTITYTLQWKGATTVASTSVAIYKDGSDTDYVSTLMPSGSFSVDGNVVTLKPLVVPATDGGVTYMIVVQNSVDGNTDRALIKLKIVRPWTGE